MAVWSNTPPQWDAAGNEPTAELKKNGFQAGYKPPADYFNYMFNQYMKCLNELQTVAEKTMDGLENYAPEKFASSNATEIETFLTGISESLGANVAYRRALHIDTGNYTLKGGTWLIEGFKYNANYEWQIASSYSTNSATICTRSKSNGEWGEWVKMPTNEADLVAVSDIETAINSTSQNPVASSAIYNAFNGFKHIGISSDDATTLNEFLDTISDEMPDSTFYNRRLSASISSFYLGSGGTWFVMGFKQTSTHEWQMAIKWLTAGATIKVRSKVSGTWQEWKDIYNSGTSISTLETASKTLVGAINELNETKADADHTHTLASYGITATAAELNKMDGVTATTAELNYVDGVTSNIQTQLNSKAAVSTGTFTLKNGSTSLLSGTYNKIGKLVYLYASGTPSNTAAISSTISGLPFTVTSGNNSFFRLAKSTSYPSDGGITNVSGTTFVNNIAFAKEPTVFTAIYITSS